MPEKDIIFTSAIKHTGLFDYKEFYSFAYTWLADEGYFITEKVYNEKIEGDSKVVEIKWEATRKVSDYFQFLVKVDWRIAKMKTVEAVEEGKKVKLEEGQLTIKVSGTLVKDWEARWEGSAFKKFLRGVYDRYIIRGRIDQYEDKIFGEMDEYTSQLKAFLALEGQH